jgi:hypothetical protein
MSKFIWALRHNWYGIGAGKHEDALMPSEKFCRQGRHARKSAGRSR